MNNPEFSAQFDVLYNNITSNQAPGINEYEKSVFLTKTQNQLLIEYFNSRTDGVGGGFDGSQKRQYDFSKLIKTVQLEQVTDSNSMHLIDRRGIPFTFPEDYFLTVNEILADKKMVGNGNTATYEDTGYQYTVLPIDYAEYQRLMVKPYGMPVKRAAWRLFNSSVEITEGTSPDTTTYKVPVVEIIGKFANNRQAITTDPNLLEYTLRYVKRPRPIILENLSEYGNDLTIDGVSVATPCELPEETHQEILERAVTLAKIAWQGGTLTQAQAAASQRRNKED